MPATEVEFDTPPKMKSPSTVHKQRDLFALRAGQHGYGIRLTVTDLVAHLAQVVRRDVIAHDGQDLQAADLTRRKQAAVDLAAEQLVLHGVQTLLELLDLADHGVGALHELLRRRLQLVGDIQQQAAHLLRLAQDLLAGVGLDAAHAGGNGGLGQDAERADLCGVVQMRAAAELQ